MVELQKRKIQWAISLFLVMLYFSCLPAQAQYGGGSGEPNDPYLIYTAEQMNEIGLHEEDWDKHFILINDIDLSAYNGTQFNIIGRWFEWNHPDNKAFSGVFDGNGKVIRNFTWISVNRDTVALFAFLGWNANGPTVKNLGMEEVNIHAVNGYGVAAMAARSEGEIANCYVTGHVSGQRVVGGLVAYADDGSVVDCYSLAIVEGDQAVGGLVGNTDTEDTNIRRCYSYSIVAGNDSVGGLVGNWNGSIRYSFSNSTVTGDSRVGGLVGVNGAESRTVDCYASGSVTGTTRVGGLAGVNLEGDDEGTGLIQRCYSSATVRGEGEHIGGLVGWNEARIISCFWDRQASGMDNMCGEVHYGVGCNDSRGKTTAEMQMASTFIGLAGCGNEGVWTIDEGVDYPRLWWENKPGESLSEQLSDFLEGTGELNAPYLIYTAEQLNVIGLFPCEWDQYFKLMSDIDLTRYVGDEFNIIGLDYRYAFTGVFDGNGKRISNFTYTSMDRDNIGLFGYVGTWEKDGVIKDLGLIDPNVDAVTGNYVGSLVGYVGYRCVITNCYAEGGSVSGDNRFGGLVGGNGGTITNCYSTASVSGRSSVGGLVGSNHRTITNCYSSSNVSGDERVGGLVGWNSGPITNCYSTASVSGRSSIGGLAGHNSSGGDVINCYSTSAVDGMSNVGGLVGGNSGTITNCYSTGSVSGGDDVGGLAGFNNQVVFQSFWDIETSGQTASAGGVGKTTAEMQMAATFLGWGGCGNEGIWTIDEGADYPRLAWENQPGELTTRPPYGGGSGTEADPYLIYTSEQLNVIGLVVCDWDKHFKLMADIDLAAYTRTDFNIIGHYVDWDSPDNRPFTGVFDGNGRTISNFSYISTDTDRIGLFRYVSGENAVIKDLGLVDPNVVAGTEWCVGSLVGSLMGGTISNCYAEGGSVSGNEDVGGLVGDNDDGQIIFCHATGSVSGSAFVGGLVGSGGTITNCSASSSVSGDESVGGLVGGNNEDAITNCTSSGSVSGNNNVGGLVGKTYSTITNCYSAASVSGSYSVGGLVGSQPGGTITNCYSTGSVSGTKDVGGLIGSNDDNVYSSFWNIETSGQIISAGGTGLTTAEMQTESTFTNAGWDFVGESVNGTEDIWRILEGQDYPRLWWQFIVVDDFEDYNDFEPDRIFDTWMDGWGVDTNGSEVGYAEPNFLAQEHFVETTIVHSGSQSMPYFYDNSGPANYSEATMTLVWPRDWTQNGVGVLSLWFYGVPANAPEPMYVAIANYNGATAVVYHDNPDAALIDTWTEWTIPLTEFSNQGVSLTDVNTISIGFGDKNNPVPGGDGLVFFDDIRLYRPAPEPEPVQSMKPTLKSLLRTGWQVAMISD